MISVSILVTVLVFQIPELGHEDQEKDPSSVKVNVAVEAMSPDAVHANLNRERLNISGARQLGSFRKLKSLSLLESPFTEEMAAVSLPNLRKLRSLDLGDTLVTGKFIDEMKNSKIRNLSIWGENVNFSLSKLENFYSLQTLVIGGPKMNPSELRDFDPSQTNLAVIIVRTPSEKKDEWSRFASKLMAETWIRVVVTVPSEQMPFGSSKE